MASHVHRAKLMFHGSTGTSPLDVGAPLNQLSPHIDSVIVQGNWTSAAGRFDVSQGHAAVIREVLKFKHNHSAAKRSQVHGAQDLFKHFIAWLLGQQQRGAIGRYFASNETFEWEKEHKDTNRWGLWIQIEAQNGMKAEYGVDRFKMPGEAPGSTASFELNKGYHDLASLGRGQVQVKSFPRCDLKMTDGAVIPVSGQLDPYGRVFLIEDAEDRLEGHGGARGLNLNAGTTDIAVWRIVRPSDTLEQKGYQYVLLLGRTS